MRQTGLERDAVESAFTELEMARPPWVLRDADVLWTTCHPLLHDPTSGLNTSDKRSGAIKLLSLLPRESSIVRKFKRINHLGGTPPRTTGGRAPEERERERERDRNRERERQREEAHSLSSEASKNHPDGRQPLPSYENRVRYLKAMHPDWSEEQLEEHIAREARSRF